MIRATAAPLRQRKAPAIALLVIGALFVLAPIVGGMFSKVASGKQMIDEFEPHMVPDTLARYRTDLATLRTGAAAIEQVYATQHVAAGAFNQIDTFRPAFPEIDREATALLDRVSGAEPDYRAVSNIGGFDRVPFLIVLAGIVALYGGAVLLKGERRRAPGAAALVVVAAVALVAYPFLSDLPSGTRAGQRMLSELKPVMTPTQVRTLQNDFVKMVGAVGQLDTAFRAVPQPGQAGTDINALVAGWPGISSDFAELVGTMNDNIKNFNALEDLDGMTGGLTNMPWLLVGIGVLSAGCALAALPRRTKETP